MPPRTGMLVLVAALALALACATAKPTRSEVMMRVAREYPSASYIVGTGSGANPDEAERNAIVNAAAGIRSSISATISSVSQERRVNGSLSTDNKVRQELEQKVQAEAAELIRPLRELTVLTDGGWVAVAVLDRRELEARYRAESDTVVMKLEALWSRIVADPGAATVGEALCEAERLEPQVDEKAVERSVTTRTEPLTAEQKRLRAEVQRIRESRRTQHVVVVARQPTGDGLPALADQLATELARRGVTARLADVATCDAVASGLVVKFEGAPACAKGGFGGIACDLSFRALAISCVDNSVVLEQPSPRARGQHATRDELALRAAVSSFDAPGYVRHVAQRLGDALGFGCRRAG